MSFDDEWIKLLKVEGGYANHAADRGGKTRYGITERVARANGYFGDMADLPVATAKGIARREYWDILLLDEVAAVFPRVAHEMFDAGYNVGTSRAGRWLQRALRALHVPTLITDGFVGQNTLTALRSYKTVRPEGEEVLLRLLDAQQAMHYLEITEANPTQRAFTYGWLTHRVGL